MGQSSDNGALPSDGPPNINILEWEIGLCEHVVIVATSDQGSHLLVTVVMMMTCCQEK